MKKLLAVLMLLLLSATPAIAEVENFELSWVVFNPDTEDIGVVSSTQVHKGHLINPTAMVLKDFGANAFDADANFTHYLSFKTLTGGNYPVFYALTDQSKDDGGTTRPLTPFEADAGTANQFALMYVSDTVYLNVTIGGTRTTDTMTLAPSGTQYWATILYDTTANTFTVNLYSNSGRTVLVETESIAYSSSANWRWVHTVGDFGNTGQVDLTVWDMDVGFPTETSSGTTHLGEPIGSSNSIF